MNGEHALDGLRKDGYQHAKCETAYLGTRTCSVPPLALPIRSIELPNLAKKQFVQNSYDSIMTPNPIDFALRVCESIAFGLHAVLGIIEPWTGCVRSAFRDNGAMPRWFWPVAGVLLGVVAAANFSKSNEVVLAAQAYIAAFHFGACFYHLRLGHHPAAACAPLVFVVFAMVVTSIRTNVGIAIICAAICAGFAYLLSRILVTPESGSVAEGGSLLSENERATIGR